MNTYPDGTRITAPFYLFKCTNNNCKYEAWAVMHKETCPKCGQAAECYPANQNKKDACLIRS
ncbi:hypothetical protein KQI61_04465 [Anaerocolumna aminovalerica]|uniref:hypothetical protein n=1 Tax=Anaerocolumna aminovalerica TaxID=1527 RepID=UPI001C0F36E2|nr:hypothetical protein [Anaerocolumna aminovalerica]MBU5331441.1 hypothetical protein [Anaerocolumna aminovalerica]